MGVTNVGATVWHLVGCDDAARLTIVNIASLLLNLGAVFERVGAAFPFLHIYDFWRFQPRIFSGCAALVVSA